MNQKVKRIFLCLVLTFCYAFTPFLVAPKVSADECESATDVWSEEKLREYAENNILYYDDQFVDCDDIIIDNPCDQGETPILEGSTNAEKIWNWIASAGISGVSNNPAVIAGILGNLKQESHFDPFIQGSKYFGLFQTDDQGLKDAFNDAGIGEYWGSSSVPEDVVDKAIDITLNYLFHNFGHTSSFLNNLDKVSHTSGTEGAKSYAELFLVTVERAVNGNDPLEDPAVQAYVNNSLYKSNPDLHNKPYQETGKRRANAVNIYNTYIGTTPSEEGNNNDCQPENGDTTSPAELVNGGMTESEARNFMQAYRNEASKKLTGSYTFDGAFVYDAGCKDGTLNNCSAFSMWFVNKYANTGMTGTTQGSQFVQDLVSNYGFTYGGKVPRVYSVFSTGPKSGSAGGWPNHTGVVLGIDEENNRLILGEASCHNGFTSNYPGVRVVNLSNWTNNSSPYGPTYAYKEGISL